MPQEALRRCETPNKAQEAMRTARDPELNGTRPRVRPVPSRIRSGLVLCTRSCVRDRNESENDRYVFYDPLLATPCSSSRCPALALVLWIS